MAPFWKREPSTDSTSNPTEAEPHEFPEPRLDADRIHAAVTGEDGVVAYCKELSKQFTEKPQKPVRIAVIGSSGAGKSSYINRARKVKRSDPSFAPVGITETSLGVRAYAHPQYPEIIYYDVPGYNTQAFPREDYRSKVKLEMYDTYIVMVTKRFKNDDAIIGKEIAHLKQHPEIPKRCFWVWTHMSDTIRDGLLDEDLDPNESPEVVAAAIEKIRNHVRQNMIGHLKKNNLTGDVYLIDNYEPNKHDFQVLQDAIWESLPELQRDAFALAMHPLKRKRKDVLRSKVRGLRRRAAVASLGSAAASAIPIPLASIPVDMAIITEESKVYRKCLGLNEKSLQKIAESFPGLSPEKVEAMVKEFRPSFFAPGVGSFAAWVTKIALQAGGMAIEEGLKFIPFIGSAVGAPVGYFTTFGVLNLILNDMETKALSVMDVCLSDVEKLGTQLAMPVEPVGVN